CAPRSTRFPYTTLFRSAKRMAIEWIRGQQILRSLPILQDQVFVSSELANHRLATGIGYESLALGGLVGIERRTIEDQVKMKAPRSEEHTSELQSRFDLV